MNVQDLLDATVDAVIVIDHRGIMQQFNRAAERLFGFQASEALGRNVTLLMSKRDAAQHDAYLGRYARTGVGHIIGIGREVQARRKDGEEFPAFLSVGCIANSDPPRYVGFLHDLTVRKQALIALEHERDRANGFLEAVQSVLVGIDAAHRVTLLNRKGCEVLGREESVLVGSDWFRSVVDAEFRDLNAHDFDRLVQQHSRQPLYCEYPIVTAGGERRLIAWRCMVVEDTRDGLTQVLCSGDDITDSRRADQEMREARERMMQVSRLATLGEMASGISHELNQPLAAIATYAQAGGRLLGAAQPDLADVREALQEIASQALRAGEIIRRLRSVVRNQASAREPCDINDVISELTPLIQADIRVSEVRLSLELAPRLPQVNLDRMQMQQVVLNLVRNAIDALGSIPVGERRLLIRTAAPAEHEVLLDVIDTGPGVSEELRKRLFVPFVTTKENGTGLGLAISRSIVESHRGRLDILPTQPHGATLRMTLPVLASG
ncbi:MAG TPA: PAS domain S-box protein [Steroidobacteraceae bacterium]|nr:PAS domain S-box protein [Steroidobacteraceae bacterium]